MDFLRLALYRYGPLTTSTDTLWGQEEKSWREEKSGKKI
jgi:hypothetical protein